MINQPTPASLTLFTIRTFTLKSGGARAAYANGERRFPAIKLKLCSKSNTLQPLALAEQSYDCCDVYLYNSE